MALASPNPTDLQSSPSHSKGHNVFNWDTAAPNDSIVVDSTGNVGIGTTTPSELLSLGTAGTTAGVLSLVGATSGKAIIVVPAAAGTPTLTLPITTGTLALTTIPTETKTDDYVVTTTDTGKTLVMNNAGTKTFSLPSVVAGDVGIWFTFAKIAAGKLIIDAADSDLIADSGAGATIYNDQSLEVYATITLQLISETQWAIVGAQGVWVTTT